MFVTCRPLLFCFKKWATRKKVANSVNFLAMRILHEMGFQLDLIGRWVLG